MKTAGWWVRRLKNTKKLRRKKATGGLTSMPVLDRVENKAPKSPRATFGKCILYSPVLVL